MIDEILERLNQFIAQDGSADGEKRWAEQQTRNPNVRALIHRLSTRDILIVATVGQHSILPQKELPALVHTSQATASRAVTRLAGAGLVIRERMPDNAKEWQLRLTADGTEVARLKSLLDKRLRGAAAVVASHYSEAELARFNEMLGEILQLSAHAFGDVQ